MIKFQKYYVTNGAVKARVSYSDSALIDGTRCITLYAKDYGRNLGAIFGAEYQNDTDLQADYFEKGLVRIRPDHPLYAAAKARQEKNAAERGW